MRRSTLTASLALSLFALITACATSPEDDLGGNVQEQKAAEPLPETNSTKLPPANNGIDSGADTGTSSGSSGTSSGSSGTSSGSSGTSSGSSGTSSGSSGTSSGSSGASSGSSGASSGSSGTTTLACDLSNPLKLILYQAEISSQSSPVPCPCAVGKCCYLGITCVSQ